MTDIEKRALALVNEVQTERGAPLDTHVLRYIVSSDEALCRAIEQHEAFRREVSDAVGTALRSLPNSPGRVWRELLDAHFKRFIIKPVDPLVDPLVDALREAGEQTGGHVSNERLAHDLREAMKARGYEWTKIEGAA